jgi:hypothetical protein
MVIKPWTIEEKERDPASLRPHTVVPTLLLPTPLKKRPGGGDQGFYVDDEDASDSELTVCFSKRIGTSD